MKLFVGNPYPWVWVWVSVGADVGGQKFTCGYPVSITIFFWVTPENWYQLHWHVLKWCNLTQFSFYITNGHLRSLFRLQFIARELIEHVIHQLIDHSRFSDRDQQLWSIWCLINRLSTLNLNKIKRCPPMGCEEGRPVVNFCADLILEVPLQAAHKIYTSVEQKYAPIERILKKMLFEV